MKETYYAKKINFITGGCIFILAENRSYTNKLSDSKESNELSQKAYPIEYLNDLLYNRNNTVTYLTDYNKIES